MVSQVYFFIPNLIGYARILLVIAAFTVAFDNYIWFFFFYALSQFLDVWDGYTARMFGQCTKFGAVLDQVTDRVSTASLLVVLSRFYPDYILFFLFVSGLDLISHYAHLYSSLSMGKGHKDVDETQNWLLRIYYTNRKVLFTLCLANEGFFLLLYLLHWWSGPTIQLLDYTFTVVQLSVIAMLPLCAVKQLMNFIQLFQAAQNIVQIDEKDMNNPSTSQAPKNANNKNNRRTKGKKQ